MIVLLLAAGWITMPTVLRASLRYPGLRYVLSLPATLVAGSLTALSARLPNPDGTSAVGWWMVTASLWFGAVLGMWLWFRWLPVPARLTDPFGTARLALVAIHIGGVLIGIALVLA